MIKNKNNLIKTIAEIIEVTTEKSLDTVPDGYSDLKLVFTEIGKMYKDSKTKKPDFNRELISTFFTFL